jgi:hypothetical protein
MIRYRGNPNANPRTSPRTEQIRRCADALERIAEVIEQWDPIAQERHTLGVLCDTHRMARALEEAADAEKNVNPKGPKESRSNPGCEVCDRYPAADPIRDHASQCPRCGRWVDPFCFANPGMP